MAVVERIIKQDGTGDYTSIAAWNNAAEHASTINGGDIYKGVISDNNAYNESITINAGSPTSSAYTWLTVASANRHAGVWDTGKARITYDGGNTAVFQLESDYVFLEWLQIHRPASGSIGDSDEGIRVTSTADTGCLISRCIIWTDEEDTNDLNGIYIGNWSITSLYIDHCVVYGWTRSGLHAQMFSGSPNQQWYVDHCAIAFCGEPGETEASCMAINVASGAASATIDSYNSWYLGDVDGGDPRELNDLNHIGSGSGTLDGSNNAYGTVDTALTLNWTSSQVATSEVPVDSNTAGEVIITDATAPVTSATDLTPQDLANNILLTNGTDRQGSEPDARQDFSVDIAGNSRGTTDVDIGPWQISGAGGGTDFEETVNDGGTEGDTVSTSVDFARSVADGGTATDGVATDLSSGITEDVNDGGTATDSSATSMAVARTEADSGTANDSPTTAVSHVRSVADGGTASDEATPLAGLIASEVDGGTATDAADVVVDFTRAPADGGSATDIPTTAANFARLQSDGGLASDGVATIVGRALTVAVADGGTASDSVGTVFGEVIGVPAFTSRSGPTLSLTSRSAPTLEIGS